LNLERDVKIRDFHITFAYFVKALGKSNVRKLKKYLEQESKSIFKEPLTFQVDNLQMYYFASMQEYKPIPETVVC
jgi:hypothetical protein